MAKVCANTATTDVRTAGQDESHYAPTTRTVMVDPADPLSWPDVDNQKVSYLGFHEPKIPFAMDVRLPRDPEAAAERLYAELQRAAARR